MYRPPIATLKQHSIDAIVYFAHKPGKIRHFAQKIGDKSKLDDILDTVCEVFGVTRKQLASNVRSRTIVIPRQIYCYIASLFTEATQTEIGMLIGDRDHTTVGHSRNTINDLLNTRNELFYDYWEMWIQKAPSYLVP